MIQNQTWLFNVRDRNSHPPSTHTPSTHPLPPIRFHPSPFHPSPFHSYHHPMSFVFVVILGNNTPFFIWALIISWIPKIYAPTDLLQIHTYRRIHTYITRTKIVAISFHGVFTLINCEVDKINNRFPQKTLLLIVWLYTMNDSLTYYISLPV